jgi:hypothetical protein
VEWAADLPWNGRPISHGIGGRNGVEYAAWRLKDEFEQFWEYSAPWAAERFIKRWMTSALRSRLDPLRKFVNTLRNHYAGVLAFVGSRLRATPGSAMRIDGHADRTPLGNGPMRLKLMVPSLCRHSQADARFPGSVRPSARQLPPYT